MTVASKRARGRAGSWPRRVSLAVAVAWLGLWVHELHRVPERRGLTLDASLPLLAIAIGLLMWWLLARRKRAASIALVIYGLVNGIGGFLSVLPLPILPFVPEQTVDHYLVHTIYSISQLPLILVALRAAKAPSKG